MRRAAGWRYARDGADKICRQERPSGMRSTVPAASISASRSATRFLTGARAPVAKPSNDEPAHAAAVAPAA